MDLNIKTIKIKTLRNIKNEKVLITGADRFIGRHLVDEYLRRGDTYVIAIMFPRHSDSFFVVNQN